MGAGTSMAIEHAVASSPVAVGATVGLFTTSGKGVNYSTQGAVGAVDALTGPSRC